MGLNNEGGKICYHGDGHQKPVTMAMATIIHQNHLWWVEYNTYLGVDGICLNVCVHLLRGGLWEELKDGFPLFQEVHHSPFLAQSSDEPRCIHSTEESSGTSCTCWPEWL